MEAGSRNRDSGVRGGYGWAFFFILALGRAGSENAWAEGKGARNQSSTLQITVRVRDYARVPPTTLEQAERQAAAILREAGIQIVWAERAAAGVRSSNQDEVQSADRLADVALGILTSSMAGKLAFPGEKLGFALPCAPDESACIADVFYQRVEELAARSRTPLPRVLACAVAHELGHLLLGANSHSERGIMRAGWRPADFEPKAAANLLFTASEADLIRGHVRERMGQRTATTSLRR
jgi:hypothetical protein